MYVFMLWGRCLVSTGEKNDIGFVFPMMTVHLLEVTCSWGFPEHWTAPLLFSLLHRARGTSLKKWITGQVRIFQFLIAKDFCFTLIPFSSEQLALWIILRTWTASNSVVLMFKECSSSLWYYKQPRFSMNIYAFFTFYPYCKLYNGLGGKGL